MDLDTHPLRGLKVLDLSRLLPGPYATLVLADLGAQVDKVEDPQGGDYLRQMAPQVPRSDESAMFYALNRNKRSLVLDLKSPAGVAALKKLSRQYDVLVESFRPGVMERLGLSYAALAEENPRLVYCSISGYGQTGPDRLRAGHDINYVARAGVLAGTGEPGGPPSLSGAQVADVGGGSLFALVGILAALQARQQTGRGRYLDVSMTEGALGFVHMHLAAQLLTRTGEPTLERGKGPLNGGYACYGVYETKDGRHLSVGSLEPKFFQGVCALLGRPDLFEHAYDQGEAGAKVKAELARLFASEPLSVWTERFRAADLCVEPVLEGADAVLADPQHQARQIVVESRDEVRGWTVKHLRTPLSAPGAAVRPPPALGQDSRAILQEAGFGEDELRALVRG